jgi:hypothetical protein
MKSPRRTGATAPYNTYATNVTASLTPANAALNSTALNFTCLVMATDASLHYVNFTIWNSTYTYYTNTTGATTGLLVRAQIDLTALNGTDITASCSFKRAGFSDWYNLTRTYFITNEVAGSFGEGMFGLRGLGLSNIALSLLSIIITMVIIGWVGSISHNFTAAGIVGLILLGVFTFWLGWFDWLYYLLVVATFGALVYLRSGGI